jgi:hypothetical protein
MVFKGEKEMTDKQINTINELRKTVLRYQREGFSTNKILRREKRELMKELNIYKNKLRKIKLILRGK